jgi:transcriptional antiterminator
MKRSSQGDSSDPDGIGDIRQKQIWKKWNKKVPPKQIAAETGESVETVYRTLAKMQKALTKRIGVEKHERRET